MRRLVYYLDAVGYGGAVNYVERLVARLDPAEFDVTIMCANTPALMPFRETLGPLPVRWDDLAGHPSLKEAAYHAAKSSRRSGGGMLQVLALLPGVGVLGKVVLGLASVLQEAQQLRRMRAGLARGKPDILHVNLDRFPDASGKLALLAGRSVGARVLATLHCQPQAPVFPARIHHHFDRRALRTADRIIVVSEKLRRDMASWYGAPPQRLLVIPNGAAEDCFEQRPAKLTRAQLGFDESDFLVVQVGSILPLRGQLILAQALSSLAGRCPRLGAALLGRVYDADYASEVDQLLATHPKRPFRRFGHRSDATEVLRLADVAVVSSFQEGHSFALLEAMALGKPIVATNIESNAVSLGHGEAGLLVPTGDSEALADALQTLYHDEALRTRLATAARLRAASEYTQERMIQATLGVYRSLAPRES